MAQKPSIPKGTRDFSQAETARREYIFGVCRDVFQLYGYAAIETPAMENLSTLMGKYGEEGDKLLFRIMNSGDNASLPPERGLRYDLTVPFARYVVQHQNEIAFPFKRYQIQPVWRADRPQKGRYREFYQCDVDVIGSRSLVNELELVQIVAEIFSRLSIAVTLKLNNRKILAGIAEVIGFPERLVDITVAIDKLEKIGLEAVKAELLERGISAEGVSKLLPILEIGGDSYTKLQALKSILAESETGLLGVEEMRFVFDMVSRLQIPLDIELDLSLARGLNYYTGTIFEVKARDWAIGSICGGGRYDDLTGIFGMAGVSGVGISFGADRIYDVMEGLGLFPASTGQSVRVLFLNFGGAEEVCSLKLLRELRAAGIAAEIYPDAAKMKRQMEWANRRGVPMVAIVGGEELARGVVTVKDMQSGEQREVGCDIFTSFIANC